MPMALRAFVALSFVTALTTSPGFATAAPPAAAETPTGLVAVEVAPDSYAAREGIKVGDILRSCEGVELTSLAALNRTLDRARYEAKKTHTRMEWESEGKAILRDVPIEPTGLNLRPQLPAAALPLFQRYRQLREDGDKAAAAAEALVAAAEAAETAKSWIAAGWLWQQVADVRGQLRDRDGVLEAQTAASGALGRSADTAAQAHALRELSRACIAVNDLNAAEGHLERAREIDAADNHRMGVAADWNGLAVVSYFRRDLKQALQRNREALQIRQELDPNSPLTAASLNNLGLFSRMVGDFPASQRYLEQSLAIYEARDPDSVDVAETLVNLGIAFRVQGQGSKAERHYNRSLDIFRRRAPDSPHIGLLLNNLSVVAMESGDYSRARGYLMDALAIQELDQPDSLHVAGMLSNLANVAHYQGDYQLVLDYQTRALAIREKLAPDSLETAGSLVGLGMVAHELGEHEDAKRLYRRALELRRKLRPDSLQVADSLNNLGNLAVKTKDLAEARRYHEQGLAICERLAPNTIRHARSLHNLAHVDLEHQQFASARKRLEQALHIRRQISPNSLWVSDTLVGLGKVARAEQQLGAAVEHFQAAVEASEQQRSRIAGSFAREQFVAAHSNAYSQLTDVQMQLNDHAAAFLTLERARAQSLLEILAQRRLDFHGDLPAALSQRQAELADLRRNAYTELSGLNAEKDAERIAELRSELRGLREQQVSLDVQIKAASPRLASLRNPRPLDAAQAAQLLEPGTLAISFLINDEQLLLIGLLRGKGDEFQVESFRSPVAAGEVSELVEQLRSAIVNRQPVQPAARRLFDATLRPAETLLSQADRLLICPDGPLHRIPWGTLIAGGSTDEPEYLIDRLPIHTVVSLGVFQQLREMARPSDGGQPKLLVLADPNYGETSPVASRFRGLVLVPKSQADQPLAASPQPPASPQTGVAPQPGSGPDEATAERTLGALPGTRREAAAIADLFGDQATLKLGDQATKEAAKRSGPADILHFACHGLIDDNDPLSSGLALASGSETDDGVLRAWEILEDVRWEADLVVLSACQTALGRGTRHEGVVGLTRAIQFAGVRSQLASLWSVSDDSTTELMRSFYKGLRGGQAKDVALQQAMREVRQDDRWRHPFYWSAFTLYGDNR